MILKVEGMFYITVIRLTMLYGSESWAVLVQFGHKLVLKRCRCYDGCPVIQHKIRLLKLTTSQKMQVGYTEKIH